MAGKKILMLVGEFSEEYAIFVFEQAMHAVGHRVDVVCPDKKAGANTKSSLQSRLTLDSYLGDHRQDESNKPNIVIEARGDQAAAKRSTTRWMAVSAR